MDDRTALVEEYISLYRRIGNSFNGRVHKSLTNSDNFSGSKNREGFFRLSSLYGSFDGRVHRSLTHGDNVNGI